MKILALETSGRVGSVALALDTLCVDERTYPHGLQHAAALVPLVDRLLHEHAITPRDLDVVALSLGPGSFTGLRVAVTFAKTLWLATGVKLVAIPTPRVLVENLTGDARDALVILDAKRGHVFTAGYRREHATAPWTESAPLRLDTPRAALARALDASTGPVHLIGEGIAYHRDALRADRTVESAPDTWRGRAGVVARLAHADAQNGNLADAMTLAPIYIRLAEAEEKRRLANGTLAPLPQ